MLPLNRTMVELKCVGSVIEGFFSYILNRTMVELKCSSLALFASSSSSLNRTMVELKLGCNNIKRFSDTS